MEHLVTVFDLMLGYSYDKPVNLEPFNKLIIGLWKELTRVFVTEREKMPLSFYGRPAMTLVTLLKNMVVSHRDKGKKTKLYDLLGVDTLELLMDTL
jgi:hypothetical protein